ncbi:MAG: phosphoglucosamine mutase [Rhodospirillaceae bacterium]|nr:phosphoglucosamine mutase [Rhodospirillaceae bacterium]
MNRRFFGTDGIRGVANREPMTATTALTLAAAAGSYFRRGEHRHRVVIGKDTRLSGYMLEPALTAGFISMGMDVILVGPLPTPAIAMLTPSLRADAGVMISASHNAYQDNGIKLFGPDGNKLSDNIELEIERRMQIGIAEIGPANSSDLGRAQRLDDAPGRYIEFAKATFPTELRLKGLKIVVDCANGAAYKTAPAVLFELGAEVIPIAVSPNGFNINKDCGAAAPEVLATAVVTHGAHVGIALDGDADRVQMVDEKGQVIDGDQLMALIARSWRCANKLRGGGVVTTVMSNMGLERYLKEMTLSLIRTKVGDRYVVEHMRSHGFNVGGEQSGHIVLTDYNTTGDGLIAALQVLAELVRSDRPTSEVTRLFEPVPQRLRSVRFKTNDKKMPLEASGVRRAVAEGESRLGDSGRIVIRKSGTEPVIRIMVEGDDEDMVIDIVELIYASIEDAAS